MQPKWTRRLGMAAVVGASVVASGGCAAERDPINRVQPNALAKSFFVGNDLKSPSDDPEFYMRNTVVDVPYGAGQDGLFTATYAQPVNRIKWEISESHLIARMTHERISNSDGKGARATNDGQVVAMFRIESHFDVRREYNSSTGEELNVIGENGSDRPWNQRQFFRVDWSRNLVTDGYEVDTASMLGIFGGVKWSPLSYYISNPEDPNAPQFDLDKGYFDITSKAFASPELIDFSAYGFGMFPACYLNSQHPVTNCNSTEVTLRLSFKKVVDTDFEPTEWDGNKMGMFGVFTEDRYGYERNFGLNDDRWHRFQAKFNVWEKSHVAGTQCAVDYWRNEKGAIQNYQVGADGAFVVDKNGLPIPDNTGAGKPFSGFTGSMVGKDIHADSNNDGTEDVCAFYNPAAPADKREVLHAGSRCDEFSRKCTLPAYERVTKVLPWYYGPGSPEDLFATTADALGQWDVAIRRAIQIRKKVEAERAGYDGSVFLTDEETIKADTKGEKVPHIFVLCHNPVRETDDAACGGKGLVARVGDLRYNMVNLVDTPQTPSPWGIMVDAVDPITGEKIAGSVNEWVHVLDIASQGTQDLMKWFAGEISDSEVAGGKYLKDWVQASKFGTAQYQPKTLTNDEIAARVSSISLQELPQKNFKGDLRAVLGSRRVMQDAMESLTKRTGPSLDSEFEARRQALMGSPFETMLITPDQLVLAGIDPKTPVAGNQAVLDRASPLRSKSRQFREFLDHMRSKTMASNGSCMVEAPEPNSVGGLARQAAKEFPAIEKGVPDYALKNVERDKKIHQWVRERFHLSVIAHEFGHSMGLRHNFTGSWDALNYHTQYWQLRTRNGKEPTCAKVDGAPVNSSGRWGGYGYKTHQNGSECTGPRWVDPVTEEEANGLVWKWGSTTVMDYPGDLSQDTNGLGSYDKAAVRFFYGETIDVDVDTGANADTIGMAKRKDYPGYLGSSPPFYFSGKHYSEFGSSYNLLGKCSEATDSNDPLSAKCTGPQVDFVQYRDMVSEDPLDKAGGSSEKPWVYEKKTGRVRHPYMFNSDEYAAPSNISNNRFDAGADAYEKAQFLITAYENRYIFDNFRRGRVTFSPWGVVSRVADRYFDMIAGVTKELGLYTQIYGEIFGREVVDRELNPLPSYMLPMALASSDGFAMFARIMTRPDPGSYTIEAGTKYARVLEDTDGFGGIQPNPDFEIGVGAGEGRFINNDYDFSQDYFWSDYQTRVGSTYEKRLAMDFLLEAYNRFVSIDRRDFIDGRWKNINYATLYPEQMRRLFSSIMQGDVTTFGPYYLPSTGGASKGTPVPRVNYPSWHTVNPNGSTDLVYPSDAVVIEPLFGWEQQFPSLISAFIYGPTTLTMDWYDQMRIFVEGGDEAVSVNGKTIRFEDPESTIVYVARDYGSEVVNGKAVPRNSGGRMLRFANDLRKEAYELSGDAVVLDSAGRPKVANAKAAQRLRRYVANLAVVRQLTSGYGPLGLGRE